MSPDVIGQGNFSISYNNVGYGGYAPNLKVDFSGTLGKIHNSASRLVGIDDYLDEQSISIPDIGNLTPVELVKQVATSIKNTPNMSLQEQEAKLEDVTKRLTQLLLNETDLSNDYALGTEQTIRGRNYGHSTTTLDDDGTKVERRTTKKCRKQCRSVSNRYTII